MIGQRFAEAWSSVTAGGPPKMAGRVRVGVGMASGPPGLAWLASGGAEPQEKTSTHVRPRPLVPLSRYPGRGAHVRACPKPGVARDFGEALTLSLSLSL